MQQDQLKRYLQEGYTLVPVDLTVDGKVFPKIEEWQTRRQVNEKNLLTWNNNSWGIVTGSLSNNLEVIDFDEKVKKGLFDEWKKLLTKDALQLFLTLPVTKTKNNGFHVHYLCKTIQGNLKLAVRKNKTTKKNETLIETRGEGGFVFETPTKGYEYIQNKSSDIKEITEDQRMVFLNTARILNEVDELEKVTQAPKTYTSTTPSSDKPWDDFNTRGTWEDILTPFGWEIVQTKQDGEKYWKRPGKGGKGISASTNYKGIDLLHIFSTSSGIQEDKSYNKFQIYTLLNHNGNYSESSKKLLDIGFGKKISQQKEAVVSPYVNKDQDGSIIFLKSSEVVSKPIEWLWEGKIAKGKVTMIAGDPGLGKSQASLHLASIVSTGGTFPGGSQCKQGSVLLFSAEDGAEDTINPRLQATKADGEKIFIFSTVKMKDREKFFDLSTDLPILKKTLESNNDISLIIIDPITAFLGETDSHKNSEVRGLLSMLSNIATEHNVAIVVVTHLNKSSGTNAMNKITGSLAFVAAARAAYMVVKDQADESRRLFLTVKNNLAVDKGGFAYKVESVDLGNGIGTSKVVWEDTPITMTLAEAMEEDNYKNSARTETVEWLEDYLKKHPQGATFDVIVQEAQRQGIASRRTLDRAEKDLFIDKIYQGKGKPKLWKLNAFGDTVDPNSVPI